MVWGKGWGAELKLKYLRKNSAFYPVMGLDRPMMCHNLCRPHKTYEIYDRYLKMIVKEGLIDSTILLFLLS